MKKYFAAIVLSAILNLMAQTTYRFVVFGDRTNGAQPGIFEKIRDEALALKPLPNFFINVGDFIEGYEKDTAQLTPEWNDVLKVLSPIKKAAPWHQVPGNHDITFDNALPHYRKYVGQENYSFDVGPDRFIVLDNSRLNTKNILDSVQFNFLKSELARSHKNRFVFCFFHQPVWENTPKESVMDEAHKLFKESGVDFVINGHYHQYIYAVRDSVHYLVVGSSGGGTDNRKNNGTRFHYVLFDVKPTGIVFNPVIIDGDTLPPDWNTDDKRLQRNAQRLALSHSVTFKPINLDYRDTSLSIKKFELVATNLFKENIYVSVKWKIQDQSTGYTWDITPLDTIIKNITPGTIKTSFFKFTQRNIIPGPQAEITISTSNDTLSKIIRPTVRKQLPVYKSKGTISIDGGLTDNVWQKTLKRPLSRFCNHTTYYDSTWIAMAYDSINMYCAFIAYEPSPDSMIGKTPSTIRDECESSQDITSFLISFSGDSNCYYRNIISCTGAIRDEQVRIVDGEDKADRSWNGIDKHAILKKRDCWQGEITIPWKSFGFSGPKPFLINCKRVSARNQERPGPKSYQSPLSGPSYFASTWIEP